MKTWAILQNGTFGSLSTPALRNLLVGVSLGCLCAGCSTEDPERVLATSFEPVRDPPALEPGEIAVCVPEQDAAFSFAAGRGQLSTAGERAGNVAGALLGFANDKDLEPAADAIEFVLTPIAAGVAAVLPGRTLPAAVLTETEADLKAALQSMSKQDHLRQAFIQASSEHTRSRVVRAVDAVDSDAATRVETAVERLSLERVSGDEFKLRIQARARVIRSQDGAVTYERPFEFVSGKALFIDWCRRGGVSGVTETGYRVLAGQMAQDIFSVGRQTPVLLGANRHRDSQPNRVAAQAGARGRTMPVSYTLGNEIEIYSQGPSPRLALPPAVSRDEAVLEAQRETEQMLDGLHEVPNVVVASLAAVSAIPIGIWKQSAALARGMRTSRAEAVDATLRKVALDTRSHQAIAMQVAQAVSGMTSQKVVLAEGRMVPTGRGTPGSDNADYQFVSKRRSAAPVDEPEFPDAALEIVVDYAGFPAREGINPDVALTVRARATLVRKLDGREIYSCPVKYESELRSLSRWAEDDAALLKEELARCYAGISTFVVKDFADQGLLHPSRHSGTLFATGDGSRR